MGLVEAVVYEVVVDVAAAVDDGGSNHTADPVLLAMFRGAIAVSLSLSRGSVRVPVARLPPVLIVAKSVPLGPTFAFLVEPFEVETVVGTFDCCTSHCWRLGSVILGSRVAESSLPRSRHAATWPTRPPRPHRARTARWSTGPDRS